MEQLSVSDLSKEEVLKRMAKPKAWLVSLLRSSEFDRPCQICSSKTSGLILQLLPVFTVNFQWISPHLLFLTF